jgi:Phage major capsid protein E.
MNQTLFVEFVKKWFGTLAGLLNETINDSKKPLPYFFKTMLRPELSPDLKWNSRSINSSVVAADVVAMDSPLPLKKRDSIDTASGTIPKLGMKMDKSEKLLTDIRILRARGVSEDQIVNKIFEDMPRVVNGIHERLEYMFLKALSTGIMLVPNEENVGTGIRVDFGYKDKNKFGVSKKWGTDGYAPLTDIANVVARANEEGDIITTIALDLASYNAIRKSEEAKALYAASIGNFTGNAQSIPTPSIFDALVADEHKLKFTVIDRSIRIEKDGKQKPVKPFAENTLVFLTSDQVGTLVYGILAEEDTPVAGVEYQKVDTFILVSKYSKNDPLREFTSSQALVLPVIENVSSIYLMNTQEAQEVDPGEIEGDADITIYEQTLVKADVITALKAIGVKAPVNISDAKLIEKINSLNDEEEAALKAALEITEE